MACTWWAVSSFQQRKPSEPRVLTSTGWVCGRLEIIKRGTDPARHAARELTRRIFVQGRFLGCVGCAFESLEGASRSLGLCMGAVTWLCAEKVGLDRGGCILLLFSPRSIHCVHAPGMCSEALSQPGLFAHVDPWSMIGGGARSGKLSCMCSTKWILQPNPQGHLCTPCFQHLP